MKITIKTLQQKSFTVTIDENETVLALKERIEAEQGPNYPVGGLKLIYSGKILNDANKIGEYNIQESSFVVVMVSKAKAPPAKPQTTTTPTTSTATPSTSQAAETIQTPVAVTETKPQQETTPASSETQQSSTTPESMEVTDVAQPTTDITTTTPQQPQSTMQEAASVLVTGSEYESALERLMGMGYSRDQCMRAMQASFNNPNRAAEYLLEGKGDMELPVSEQEGQQETVQQETVQPEEGEQPPAVAGGGGSGGGGGEGGVVAQGGGEAGGGVNPFQVLLQVPQFQQLRREIARNPAMLQMVLQQIRQSNPPLFEAISQNQDEFLSFLNNPSASGTGEEAGSMGMPPGAGGGPPGTVSIPVTQEEKAAIERLKGLGFPEHEVIEAYFACDKNEELAANFLFQDKD